MTRSDKYVALDAHQATTLASVRAETGRVIARTVLPTAAPAVVEFFRGMRGSVHVVFEEPSRSARSPCALDNRSHRTTLEFCCRTTMPTRSASCKASVPDPLNLPGQQQFLVRPRLRCWLRCPPKEV